MTRTALLLLGLAFSSCGTPRAQHVVVGFATPVPAAPRAHHVTSVIVVTLDGARWQDIFEGDEAETLTPNLHRWMTREGVAIGAPGHGEIWSSGPNYVSMPGYTEIFTGRPSACQSNECGQSKVSTLVDELSDAVVISSWERIALVATRSPAETIMSAGRHGGAHRESFDDETLRAGEAAHAWPGIDDYRPDASTMRIALRLLDTRKPTFTFIGLGDTDEHAHHGDHAQYLAALRAADAFLGEIERRVDDDTVVLVTADHGRSDSFRDHGAAWHESGRVWLVARGPHLAARGLLDTANHRLADIAPTIRCLLEMPRDVANDAGVPIRELCGS